MSPGGDGRGEVAMVPRAEPRSYYGQPVLKRPVWTWEIPLYFFTGGTAGASAGLAWASELRGNDVLARRAWTVSGCAITVSPVLLISDLGRPARFLNMLRLLKVTSPMSVGSWLLGATATAIVPSALDAALPAALRRRLPEPLREALGLVARPAKPAAALLGLPLSTYTAALVASTAVPAWHEARWMLPFVFAGGAAASAGGIATLATPPEHAGPARRLAVIGALAEVVAARTMRRRLGELGRPYGEGLPGVLSRASELASATGGVVLAAFGHRGRTAAIGGGALLAAGALLERLAVFRVGFASAVAPEYVVGPQRERIERGRTRGAERVAPSGAARPSPRSDV
jgi:hypothetical protein